MATQNRSRIVFQAYAFAALIVAAAIVSVTMMHRYETGSMPKLAWSLLPVPFFLLGFWFMFRIARGCDELHQRMQFEALAFAFPLAMIFAITGHLLHKAGFAMCFDLADLFVDMGLLYFTGVYLAWRRYR